MKPTPADCVHLTVDVVRQIHAQVLRNFGGAPGIRDEGLLASAVYAPQSSFGGKSPYSDIIEIAAAYLFYLCRNHPFVDGNKRTALAAAIVFLRLNDTEPAPDSAKWEKLVLDVAANELERAQTTSRLRKLIHTNKRAKEARRTGKL